MLFGMCIKYIWIAGYFCLISAVPRIDHSDDSQDFNDIVVYNAVVKSMREWQAKKSANRTKREEPSVCYEGLGCFDASGPFGYLDMLPSKPEDINTRFLLYPARNRQRRSSSAPTEIPFEKLDEAFEWAKGGFNKSLPTKVLIHGFGSDCGYIWAYEVRSALIAVEEVNTICVDWSNGAALPNYVKASANTRLVGKQLSLLLSGLVEKNGLSLMNTHLIGFSLGAHIAGFAGADLGNLSRITGLDPAGPLFESQDTRARLDETDASFVDVIHSNGENLILGGLGSSQPMGHVDFYPNGGRMQKGCSHLFVGAVSDIIWSSAVEGRSLCNHRRAYKFFIDSVSPRCHFPAFPCDSYDNFISGKCFPCTEDRKCGNMGYYADRSKGRGQLFLITREEEPFCAHQYLVRIETSPSPTPVKSYGKIQVTLIGDSFLNETFMLTKKEDEEMKLGESLSKIVVLHPILSQPTKIELLYTAYSGWLSSGLTQWKIDKVTLMDSFGKVSSMCKEALVLESGIPVTLSLHPNDCNEATSETEEEEIPMQQAENVHPGYLSNKEESTNLVDMETESSRAFNSRVIKADKLNKNNVDGDGLIREVVEPILKTHSVKNGRAHNPGRGKLEISEPILGPTTVRSFAPEDRKETDKEPSDWASQQNTGEKWKREDESKSLKNFASAHRSQQAPNGTPLEAIVTTVQFLPQRLARMFEQAEKYARETILPLVSTYTPRFISEFIGPRQEPKYVPLHYEEDEVQQTSSSKRISTESGARSRNLLLPLQEEKTANEQVTERTSTPYTHIQRITKKTEQTPPSNSLPESTSKRSEHASSSTSSSLNTNTSPQINIKINYGQSEPAEAREDLAEVVTSIPSGTNATLMQRMATTLQSIPDSFARMLGQMQNYTRRNILPLVQSYSPRRLSDLIWIRPKPTGIMKIERNRTSSGTMQGQNFSISWDISRDFNESSTEEESAEETTTDLPWTSTVASTTDSRDLSRGYFRPVPPITEPISRQAKVLKNPDIIRNTVFRTIFRDLNVTIHNNKDIRTEPASTTVKSFTVSGFSDKIDGGSPQHVQRIPKRGQKANYHLPQPFTIAIDPNDLTTTSRPTTSTTFKSTTPKEFVSYVQKIPKKKTVGKTPQYKVIRNHPVKKDFNIGNRVFKIKHPLGIDLRYRINSDGKYETY
ncbi:uncharacterized protein LOC109537746 isoform X2 [Dendroctonus ponderosae]|uniref:uncharacterized protein LOC109537746 isoform X2 n=1 Tax=Dendroctonus ponderosae TaxID=77166 RepID=UPI002035E1F5|nr:uncharacterized protein LOC109537746 isoform X2 [Dendroctonus ponderosae]